jgi:membrane protein DedA with SNARE-associated domain
VFDVHSLLTQFGPWAVFVLVALESSGLPLPGETSLVAAAALAGHSQDGSIVQIVILAAAGAIVGDNVGFWVGRAYGPKLLLAHGSKIGLDEDRLKLGQYLFQRYGGAIVFFGRFVAFLRAFAATLAGANRLAPLRFLLFNAAGGIVWASVFGLGGYALGADVHRIAGPFGLAALALALVGLVVGGRYLRAHEARLIARARAAFPEPLGLNKKPKSAV